MLSLIICVWFAQAVNEALSVGAPLLLPPLLERMEVLHTLLPQGPEGWDSLTVGEVNFTRMCFVLSTLYLLIYV